ncbi:hypothetical protein [Xylocopilactobacillus apicola]|uniref:DUF2187 domain-containing protein n=1 Tax=Xylocopilactobacillus apicola TaxID=2932184 RepID=A0AAU9DLZ6_9LACO|nr:hypothetical protein [Xylocopilactobacillus apicola]BDR59596.1 hypothetical protein XA3_20370 [Xylocopilactobacillus apicola]
MAKKSIEIGDRVKVSKGEGVSIPFEGEVIKLYENSALVVVDDNGEPSPITTLNLPNSFVIVRQSLCTAIDANGKELKAKKSTKKNPETEDK